MCAFTYIFNQIHIHIYIHIHIHKHIFILLEEGGVSAHEPIICTFFNPVDPANSLILDHSSNGSTFGSR